MAGKGVSLDEKIARYEKQLKEYKAQRRKMQSREAREAKKRAERERSRRLMEDGLYYQTVIMPWMDKTRFTSQNGEQHTVLEWFSILHEKKPVPAEGTASQGVEGESPSHLAQSQIGY